jgi:hypothetical protein
VSSMSTTRVSCIATILVFGVCVSSRSIAGEISEKATLDMILRAWQARERNTKSFDVMWSGIHFELGSRLQVPLSRPDAFHTPPKEVVFETLRRFSADEKGRLRIEMDDKTWLQDKAELGPQSTIKIIDGQFRQVFFPCGREPYPVCFVGDRKMAGGNDARLIPVRLLYRPFDVDIGLVDPMRLKATGASALIGEESMLVIEHDSGTIWVDPRREFVPVRFERKLHGFTDIVEIQYGEHSQHGWAPVSWTITAKNSKGDVVVSDADSVRACHINQVFHKAEFALALPDGTLVTDSIAKETYLTLPHGERRLVLKGEFNGHNYEQLLHSNTGSLLPNRMRRMNLPTIALVSIGLLALVVVTRRFWKLLHRSEPRIAA